MAMKNWLDVLTRPRTVHYRGVNDDLLSLRGFAAMIVLIFHGMIAFTVDGYDVEVFKLEWTTPLHIANQLVALLMNGGAAVTFFFVHSGFVLTLSLSQRYGHGLDGWRVTAAYFLRRVLRLYPVIALSVMAGWIFYIFCYDPIEFASASPWLKGFFGPDLTLKDLFYNLALVSNSLNQFVWSLIIESQLSILMPLLFFALLRNGTALAVLVACVMAAGMHVASWMHEKTLIEPGVWVVHKYFFTYIACFLIGGFATTLAPGTVFLRGLPGFIYRHRIALCLAVLVVARPLLVQHQELAAWVETMASVVIVHDVYFNQGGWLQRLAAHPLSRFYGRISYSLYMFSSIGIYIMARLLMSLLGDDAIGSLGFAANIAVTCLSIVFVTGLATLSYYSVEEPFMNWGKRLSRRWEEKQAAEKNRTIG